MRYEMPAKQIAPAECKNGNNAVDSCREVNIMEKNRSRRQFLKHAAAVGANTHVGPVKGQHVIGARDGHHAHV